MLKALTLLLVLGGLTGASWIAFSIYRVKHANRLIPAEELMERAETFVNAPGSPQAVAGKVGAYLDANVGRCVLTTLPKPGTNEKPKPIEGRHFSFSGETNFKGVATLCEFPEFGKETLFTPVPLAATFSIHRRWKNSAVFYLREGTVHISSNELHLEWAAPGMRVEIKSAGPASLTIEASASQPNVMLKSGKFMIAPLRQDLKSGAALPIRIGAFETATMSSDGKPLLAPGDSTYLLPSGFSDVSAAPAATVAP